MASRAEIRARLRQRAGEFLQRFYRHEILTARAVRGVQAEAVQRFRQEVAEPLIQQIGGGLAGFEPRGHGVTPQSHPELQAIIREAEAIIARGVDSVRKLTEQRAERIAKGETEFVASNTKKTTGETITEPPAAEATKRPFLGDKTEDWFKKMLTGPTADGVRQRIAQGIAEGRSVDQIVQSIRGTRNQRGVLDASQTAVQTLVRTASTAASSTANAEAFKELGATHWRFVATLDGRTSDICRELDGKRYPLGTGPLPPRHPNCRSVIIPDLGGPPVGERASQDGPVPAGLTYEEWERQRGGPAEV